MPKKTTKLPAVNCQTAARIIADGGLVAYPTEGVFGIGCDPANPTALQKLLDVKARDPGKGLILIAASIEQLSPWIAPLSDAQRQRIGSTWPGPVTWVVPARDNVPSLLSGGRNTLAARVSAHPPVIELCSEAHSALVSTSANRSGEPPARHPDQLTQLDGIDAYLDAPVGNLSSPTPIYDLRDGALLRI